MTEVTADYRAQVKQALTEDYLIDSEKAEELLNEDFSKQKMQECERRGSMPYYAADRIADRKDLTYREDVDEHTEEVSDDEGDNGDNPE